MKKLLLITALLAACMCRYAYADTALVKLKSGVELKGTILSFDPASEIVLDVAGFEIKINISEVDAVERIADAAASIDNKSAQPKTNPGAHPAVTHKGTIKADKKGNQYIEVIGDDGQELTIDYVSKEDKTLKVTKPRKGLDYILSEYVIPEYVIIDNDKYIVTTIGENAFNKKSGITIHYETLVKEIMLPSTLKTIEKSAFACNEQLSKIIIPDSVESVGDEAFLRCGRYNKGFEYIHIPETVMSIGTDAFRYSGFNMSYRGFFQGILSSIPNFITIGNCTKYGIDEEAVEDYYSRNGK